MEKRFERNVSSLARIFDFVEEFANGAALDRNLLLEINLAIEEIFTNMVKYSRETAQLIGIDLEISDGGVVVTMTDADVDPFDVTSADSDDMQEALEERATGGRGLFLVKQIMDSIAYEYDDARRTSRIIMTRALEK